MKKVCLVLSLYLVSMFTYSQNSETDKLLKKLVEKQVLTEQEAEEIKKESKKENLSASKIEQTADKVRNIFNNTPYFQIGGYGLFLYRYDNTERIKHDAKARVIFLHAKGQLTDNISYFFMSELVDPQLFEYYMDWTPIKEINFRFGQFNVPFTLENPISVSSLGTIQNSRSVSSLAGMANDVMSYQNGKNNSGRDMGMQISGNLLNDKVEYSVGIFQGSGMNTSDKDNTKNFAGTLLLKPVKGLRIGGSALFGGATYQLPFETVADTHVRNRWSFSGDYQSERLYVRAEWIRGKDSSTKKEGIYGTTEYYIVPEKLNIIGKVDYYNQDKRTGNEVIDYLAGLDYYFYTRCRVQINYQYSDYSRIWDAKNSHTVMGQLQFVF